MKSGKERFSGLLQKKKAPQSTVDSSKGPQAGGPVTLKPDPDQLATRIKRTPLYVAAAVIGLGSYGGYLYLQDHPMFGNTHPKSQAAKINPASSSGAPASPKHSKQYSKPVTPGETSGTPATASTNSGAQHNNSGTGNSEHQTPSGAPKKNPYAAQDAAFGAALGTGSAGSRSGGGLNWKIPSAAPSQTPTTLPVATPTAGTSSGKKKSPPPLVTRETSPYEILSGSVIPAVLQTGIKSYLPGEITAVVSQSVYSSVNGATLLIPAGSRLVGTYDTQTALGVNRLAVAWTRIEFPNGTSMNLPGYEGEGGSGYAGLSGDVNDHTWLIFKNALLLSIVDAGMAVASPTSTSTTTTGVTGNAALQDSEQSLAQTFGQAESQLLQKYIDIAPTITLHPGQLFSVVVAHDMVFPGPYDPTMQTGVASPEPALGPKLNPYG
jgi:type IV secretion system protein VirB10